MAESRRLPFTPKQGTHVVCEVTPGLRDSERTAAVRDIHGKRQFLRVEQNFLSQSEDGKNWLPIGVITDTHDGLVLIELPHEADSGANRLWVKLEDINYLAQVRV